MLFFESATWHPRPLFLHYIRFAAPPAHINRCIKYRKYDINGLAAPQPPTYRYVPGTLANLTIFGQIS